MASPIRAFLPTGPALGSRWQPHDGMARLAANGDINDVEWHTGAAARPAWRRGGAARRTGNDPGAGPGQTKAPPTMMFRTSSHGDPCERLWVCVGCPFASPPVPCISYWSGPETASRFAQKSVVMAW